MLSSMATFSAAFSDSRGTISPLTFFPRQTVSLPSSSPASVAAMFLMTVMAAVQPVFSTVIYHAAAIAVLQCRNETKVVCKQRRQAYP